MFLFFHDSICAMRTFSSSTNNFAHAQTLSRMSSLSGRMNIARVNIDTLLDAGRWFSPGIPVSSTYKSGIKHHKTNQPIIMFL
jgi:hypothetical protein